MSSSSYTHKVKGSEDFVHLVAACSCVVVLLESPVACAGCMEGDYGLMHRPRADAWTQG